ncbi:hypothetical protein AB6887_05235 [Carnobacterium divergens]|uniref:hypothetical protein n=1 Tax=Carnobacterium divergens TaxID=2748 RepID=UPI0039C98F86
MKEIFKINEEEFGFSESQLVEDDYLCENPWTDVPLPQPCWKPKFNWNSNTWVETATEEEMNPPEVKPELTEVEELGQKISEMELADLEKENRIKQLEAENEVLGMQQTDNDLRLMELEEKLNGTF